ncbi:MAG TPA: hypothetical protein VFM92_08660 [Marivirga sp.]|nr:hypothetical protein [Marivirga sp.]
MKKFALVVEAVLTVPGMPIVKNLNFGLMKQNNLKSTLYFLILILLPLVAIGQKKDLRESLYLHTNKRFLVSGERLLFSAFLRSDLTKKLTDNSRILYVEIIGENGIEDQQKVALVDGLGAGSFFINSSIPSGNYNLVAYTRWMRNFNDFLTVPITIINPYKRPEEKQQESIILEPTVEAISKFDKNEIIIGIENEINVKLLNVESFTAYSADLVDGNGEILQSLSFDESGIDHFTFTPESEKDYRIILADSSGRRYFSNIIVIAKDKSFLKVNDFPNRHEIEIVSNRNSNEDYQLKVGTGQEIISSYNLRTGNSFAIRNNEIPTGFILLELFYHNTLIDQAWYINEKESLQEKETISEKFDTRTNVSLSFPIPQGTYSVSVKKSYEHSERSPFHSVNNEVAFNIKPLFNNSKENNYLFERADFNQIKLLPESRNELLEGKVIGENRDSIESVFLSFAGKNYQIVSSEVNKEGNFLLHFVAPSRNSNAYIGLFENDQTFSYELKPQFIGSELDFDYAEVSLTEEELKEIEERSINVQIQDIYQSQLEDSLNFSYVPWDKTLINFEYEYVLENYKKFRTIEEHLIEYVLGVRVRNDEIKITQVGGQESLSTTSLILLDGIPVSSKQILEINPLKIKAIRTRRDLIFVYDKVFNGVVEFISFDSNLSDFKPNNAEKVEIKPLSRFTASQKSEIMKDNIPLRNDQLLWSPFNNVENDSLNVEFMTNDLEGEFQIEVEGFTETGKPISIIQYFNVMSAKNIE